MNAMKLDTMQGERGGEEKLPFLSVTIYQRE